MHLFTTTEISNMTQDLLGKFRISIILLEYAENLQTFFIKNLSRNGNQF